MAKRILSVPATSISEVKRSSMDVLAEQVSAFSDMEIRGAIASERPDIDEEEGWE